MQNFIHTLATVPPLLTYLFAFVWLAFESCGLPLPNELVLLLLGSLIAQRHSPVEIVALVLVATAGSLLGATVAYFIGARGGRPAVLKLGRALRMDEQRLNAIENWFNNSGGFAIGVSRITPFVRTYSSFPAGVLRMPLRVFLLATTLGSLLWCAALVSVGYALGANYMIALNLIEKYTIPAIIILVALIACYIWLHQRLSKVGVANSTTTPKAGSSSSPTRPGQPSSTSRPTSRTATATSGGASGGAGGGASGNSPQRRRTVSRGRQRPRR